MRTRTRKSDGLVYEPLGIPRTLVVVAFVAVAAWYLAWRPGTFNPDAMAFSVALYAAEIYGVLTALLHIFMVRRLSVRTPPPAPAGYSVDVLVPTYDEPVDMVRRTLLAAVNMDYPHAVWLLDDGNRPEMRALARELGCRYVARGENVDAKAGNLNNALKFTKAQFVAVFDADHAPARGFLAETLGYFRDPQVAFVQTPQDFYNLDSFQHRRHRDGRLVWTEQSLFFRVIMRGKDCWNAAFFCGSCAVVRRAVLDEIGGFATGTVTEDLHTSIRIHKRGYRSVYHATSLAYGLAPVTVSPFLRQRVRWGQGAMQVWRREGILFARGLTLAQRLNYFASVLTYFDGWQKGLFYLAPVVVLATGVMPIVALNEEFLWHFVPYYLLVFWTFEELGRGFGRTLQIEQYNMARFAAFILATTAMLRGRIRFTVTQKTRGGPEQTRRSVVPQYAVLVLNVLAIPVGVALYAFYQAIPLEALAANVFWAALNSGLAGAVVSFSTRVATFPRRDYRFPVPVPARLVFRGRPPALGTLDDVSSSGFRFYGPLPEGIAPGSPVSGQLFIPSGAVRFQARVRVLVHADTGPSRHVTGVGCSFEWASSADRDQLDLFLYGSDLQWRLNELTERATTPISWLARRLRPAPRHPIAEAGHWAPVLFHLPHALQRMPEVGLISVPKSAAGTRTLVTWRRLEDNLALKLRVLTRRGSKAVVGRLGYSGMLQTQVSPVYLYEFAR